MGGKNKKGVKALPGKHPAIGMEAFRRANLLFFYFCGPGIL
jgi:hypothetical protein